MPQFLIALITIMANARPAGPSNALYPSTIPVKNGISMYLPLGETIVPKSSIPETGSLIENDKDTQ